jgi:hypothetical protein
VVWWLLALAVGAGGGKLLWWGTVVRGFHQSRGFGFGFLFNDLWFWYGRVLCGRLVAVMRRLLRALRLWQEKSAPERRRFPLPQSQAGIVLARPLVAPLLRADRPTHCVS